MASAAELLAVCSWDFSPDPANVYSLSVLVRPRRGPAAGGTHGGASYPTLLVATARELLAYDLLRWIHSLCHLSLRQSLSWQLLGFVLYCNHVLLWRTCSKFLLIGAGTPSRPRCRSRSPGSRSHTRRCSSSSRAHLRQLATGAPHRQFHNSSLPT